ncbi:hypothetical protein F1880_005729 [Penicillium rolfsii]|nr:hypothetical protein F1880_005729 [Penicillium rolfsii]
MAEHENNEDYIKNIVGIRRRPNMTRKEFYDHHFRVHGYLSDAPQDKNIKPHKYMQTHVFDSAFGNSPEGPNANHSWVGRDDVTELFFRDLAHLGSSSSSPYLALKIAPDGPKFAESGSPTAILAPEKRVSLKIDIVAPAIPEGKRTVAILFVSFADKSMIDSEQAEKVLSPKLVDALQTHPPKDAWGLIVNVDIDLGFDMMAFFDCSSVTSIREAQNTFYRDTAEYVSPNNSFILFGVEGLINDMDKDIRFDVQNQPRLDELPGLSHLDGLDYTAL